MNKKLFLAALVLLMGLTPKARAEAYSFVASNGDTLYYVTDYNGTAVSITAPGNMWDGYWGTHTKPTGSLVIPSSVTHNGTTLPVTSIEGYAFCQCSGLTSVTIPSSVTSIGNYAFEMCSGLTYIVIPEGVTTIGPYAFSGCTGLASVTISNSVSSIGNYAFQNCTSLDSITVGYGLTSVGYWAFNDAPVTYLNRNCNTSLGFGGTSSSNGSSTLATVILGDSVTIISAYAFKGCSNLTSVTVGSGVTSIGNEAFRDCSALPSVNLSDGITKIPQSCFSGCTSLLSAPIPSTVSYIGSAAFSGCSNLANVIIPNAVDSIEGSAFYNCGHLDTLIIGRNVTYIGNQAFSNVRPSHFEFYCQAMILNLITKDSLKSVIIGDSTITSIGTSEFAYCDKLQSATIGSGVTSIGQVAFFQCSHLESIVIPEGVTSIGEMAFMGTGLTSVTLPSSLTTVGSGGFDCPYLSETHFNGTVGQWMNVSFNSYNDNPVRFSKNLYLGDTLLRRLIIPEGITTIYNHFQGDTALTYVSIPSTVTYIAADAFNGCGPNWFRFYAVNPPALGSSSAFLYTQGGNTYGSWMMVPWQSLEAYKTAENYTTFAQNLLYPDSCMLSVIVNDPARGTVTLDGTNTLTHLYQLLDTASVDITPLDTEHYQTVVTIDGCTNLGNEGDLNFQVRLNRSNAHPTVQVDFVGNTHHVYAVANGSAYGTVAGTDDYHYGDIVTVEASPADGYYFVRWADGSTENPATFICYGDTTVTAIFSPIVTPELCMVSVQDDRNVLLWNTEDLPIVNYTVYREGTVSGEYDAVATIPYAEAGQFTDSDSRPASRSYRYRITATDTCGNESPAGGIHKTMHLTISQGVGSTWNLVWTPYEGAEYTTYIIYRGTDASNVQQIDIMPSDGNTTYSDNSAPAGNVYYQVGVLMTTPCNNAKSATVSRSNIASSEGSTPINYTITVLSADTTMGTVTGGDTYAAGAPCTITATPKPGYHFVRWNDNITANPYTFNVAESATYTAYFEANSGTEVYYTVTVVSDNTDMGTVSGGGQVLEHASVSISATAINGYHFVRWNDNNTDNPRIIADVTSDATYTAYFEADTPHQGIGNVCASSVKLYPNPTSGNLHVEAEGLQKIEVIDAVGRVVLSQTDGGSVNMNVLANGIYSVRVTANGATAVKKVVKR